MTQHQATVAILSFSWIERDARVLRHAHALSDAHDVVLVGYADADCRQVAGARVHPVPFPTAPSAIRRVVRALLLVAGRMAPAAAYERLYWDYPLHRQAYEALHALEPSALMANDWQALPVVARVAAERDVPLVLDLHEHATEQHAERAAWRWFRRPMAAYMLGTYARDAAQVITVNEALAASYRSMFDLDANVILNAPDRVALPAPAPTNPDHVTIVHHGVAAPSRRLECMVEAVALAEPRYHLDLMLVPTDAAYLRRLEELAAELAPDRVRVVPPVAPADIVPSIAGYDLGMFVLPPANWQHEHCLPNKLFDFVVAGLGTVLGPSPEMSRLVRRYDCGVVAKSFEPRDVADALDQLAPDDIDRMKVNARQAGVALNGQVEAEKLRKVFASLARSG